MKSRYCQFGSSLLFSGAFALSAQAQLVINEIHYNPLSNPVRQEFVEILNTGAASVDLSGWRLSSAVDFVFPGGTSIAPGGYLIVAEDPPTMLSTMSVAALGPWTGSLSSDGEVVRLRDAGDVVVDEADYKVGFPWPVASDGSGASMELINPALDNSLGSSWRSSVTVPTPKAQNSVFAANAAPNIRKVEHLPEQPASGQSITVTAKVSDPDGVASVQLEYQIVLPGAYVPSHLPLPIVSNNINTALPRPENSAYETGWTTLTMRDDGTDGDAVAGDEVFTATIPAQSHRTLVRYRITVTDALSLAVRVPYPDDSSLNFACFVYDGVPAYEGTPATVMANTLPVYHLLTRAEDYSECIAYDAADRINQGTQARFLYNWSGTIVYDGVVYDNITYRLRGANGRYQSTGKRSMRFRLNDGHFLQARDRFGKKYNNTWRTLTLGKCSSNRLTLTFGLNEVINFYLFNKVGVPGADAQWLQWRVIDGADEAPDKSHGDFHGFYLVTETYDVRFLEEHNMEKGNLYKLINQTGDWAQQQRYQAAFAPANGADHNTIEGQLDGGDSADYIRAHVNLDKWYQSHALVQAIRHYDYWPSANKNMVYYFEPVYLPENDYNGKLWILPWDTDASWGPTYNNGYDVVYNALFSTTGGGSDSNSTPELWPEYFNHVREIRDLLWRQDQIEPLIDEFAARIAPLEAADAARWKGTPSDAGNYSGLHGPGLTSLDAYVQDMKNFAFVGGSWDGGAVGAGGRAAFLDAFQGSSGEAAQLPATPTISYTGAVDFPTDGLKFDSSPFSDPQGNNTFAAMEWRVAEITPLGGRTVTAFPAGSDWKFLDDGSDQGTAWSQAGFDDSAWASGATPAGYGSITGTTIVNQISFGGVANDRHETTYFRRALTVEDPALLESLDFGLHLDDGAVVYINGVEVKRDGFNPTTVVGFDVLADADGNEGVFDRFEVSATVLQAGENIIAVEVHQRARGSSDLVFDMDLKIKERLLPLGEELKLEWDAVWESGELTTFTTSQEIPVTPIRPGKTYRARVRHLDTSGRWSHWSEGLQFVATEPDTTPFEESIVISEFMYHPVDPTLAEAALGYGAKDFEFIEIMNISNAPRDLNGLRFTKGIDFDFTGTLAPGGRTLVVSNLAAFESRYGAGQPIAGEWQAGDNLSNGGEQLKLSYGAGVPIRDFIYLDTSPWPTAPDSAGFSLTLIDPGSNPDHAQAINWRSSVQAGGSPGSSDASDFASWASAYFLGTGDPGLDSDSDGIGLFREYAQGGRPDAALKGEGEFEISADEAGFIILTIVRNPAADDVAMRFERSLNAGSGQWQDATGEFSLHAEEPLSDGRTRLHYRAAKPAEGQHFWRARFLTKS